MKSSKFWRVLSLTALVLLFIGVSSVSATPGEQNGDSLSVTQPKGGAYVHVTNLSPGDLDFKFGWNNSSAFASPPVGYWIGVYDITASSYVWASDNPLSGPAPKLLKLSSLDATSLISGHSYAINFFVRSDYSTSPYTNATIVQVYFIAP